MSKPSLSQLFQSATAPQTLSARAMIDADTALRAANGRIVPHERDEVVSALQGSSAHADLVRFLRALEPSSAELAHGLAHGAAVHEGRERTGRGAHGRRTRERGWQWGAVAASFIAVAALFVARQDNPAIIGEARLAHQPAVAADLIFDGSLDKGVAHQVPGDTIFRDDSMEDRLFSAQVGG